VVSNQGKGLVEKKVSKASYTMSDPDAGLNHPLPIKQGLKSYINNR